MGALEHGTQCWTEKIADRGALCSVHPASTLQIDRGRASEQTKACTQPASARTKTMPVLNKKELERWVADAVALLDRLLLPESEVRPEGSPLLWPPPPPLAGGGGSLAWRRSG